MASPTTLSPKVLASAVSRTSGVIFARIAIAAAASYQSHASYGTKSTPSRLHSQPPTTTSYRNRTYLYPTKPTAPTPGSKLLISDIVKLNRGGRKYRYTEMLFEEETVLPRHIRDLLEEIEPVLDELLRACEEVEASPDGLSKLSKALKLAQRVLTGLPNLLPKVSRMIRELAEYPESLPKVLQDLSLEDLEEL